MQVADAASHPVDRVATDGLVDAAERCLAVAAWAASWHRCGVDRGHVWAGTVGVIVRWLGERHAPVGAPARGDRVMRVVVAGL